MKIHYSILIVICFLISNLVGCGGGDDEVPPAKATVTGQVSGTTFIAVDNETGEEYGRDVATGVPKTFQQEVLVGRAYRYYLLEGEVGNYGRLFPIYQDNVNVFTVNLSATGDLGLIKTSTGIGIPANNPLSTSAVSSGGENVDIPSSLSADAYTTSDFIGTWHVSLISSGITPEWCRSTYGIDSAGLATMTENLCSSGSTSVSADSTFSTTPAGVISFSDVVDQAGYMNKDKNAIVSTGTASDATYQKKMFIKKDPAVTFSTDDFAGTWYASFFRTGSAPGWCRSKYTISPVGLAEMTENLCSDGSTVLLPETTLTLSSDGIVTAIGGQGYMAPDKNLMILTGDIAGVYQISAFTRVDGAVTFSVGADLAGTWYASTIFVGTQSQWCRSKYVVDSGGIATMAENFCSNGSNDVGPDFTLSISSEGKVTAAELADQVGYMNVSKDTIYATSTSGGKYQFITFNR
ncbi:MAG: hypothetical protein KKA70_09085 [Proteobacteria bacterium]|nr:hypothetical protein [Pseudomonadota bacterium]